jgi:hypothetical protein
MVSNCVLDDYCSLVLSFSSLQFSWNNYKEKQDLLRHIADGDVQTATYLQQAAQRYTLSG